MPVGLRIRNPANNALVFDSTAAVGGVCMGMYSLPNPNMILSYPELGPGHLGIALNAGGDRVWYTYDNDLGYPRFSFPYGSSQVTIFIK